MKTECTLTMPAIELPSLMTDQPSQERYQKQQRLQRNNARRKIMMGHVRRRPTAFTMILAATATLAFLHTPSSMATSLSAAAKESGGFDSLATDPSADTKDGDELLSTSQRISSTKTIFRVFQTLPREPSTMTPTEATQMYRTIRATQAMIFAPSQKQQSNSSSNGSNDGEKSGNNNNMNSVVQDDNVELALDIYSPSERREYLVKRGNRCHPRSSSSGSSSSGSNADGLGIDIDIDEDNKSLQWYDVLSRYDSLMSAAASASSGKEGTSNTVDGSKQSSSANNNNIMVHSSSAELERAAIELFKFCVLYNADGHAYWGWDEQLLLPFRDVVNVDVNYGVVAGSSDMSSAEDVNENVDAMSSPILEGDGNNPAAGAAAPQPLPTNNAGSSGNYIHESFLSISPFTPATSELSAMIRLLLETSDDTLASNPLFLPRELHRLIVAKQKRDSNSDNIGNNAAVVAAAEAAAAEGAAGDTNDGSSDGEKGNGATWTLLRNNCIPLADSSQSSSSSSSAAANSGVASSGSVVVDSSSSRFTVSAMGGISPLDALTSRMADRCPLSEGGYCCLTFLPDKSKSAVQSAMPVMALRHPVGGWTSGIGGQDANEITMPYKSMTQQGTTVKLGGIPETDMPYVATVRLVVNNTNDARPGRATNFPTHSADAPNFFDILFENDCLPYRKECHRCLKDEANELSDPNELSLANACSKCQLECPCYCDILCKVRPPPKPITRTYAVQPPQYRKDPERLVPKIIHQTWFEPVEREKYPNMSRLIESWKKSGWEYYFYDDETAGDFLETHFPPEVREAYESITPGAFKADLFRYCVLLIRGGVYADMDVLLQTNLDDAIANDIGFMTPIDQPGITIGHRSCLWNGLIASAPAHPFLARTIEIVVNNIRNRFTAVDYDDMLCPNPVLSVVHTVDTLFTCGPCILGAGINNLMGLHMQTQFEVGDIDIWQRERTLSKDDNDTYMTSIRPDDQRLLVPGRTIILEQNKNDMGAHRFTWADRHLIVAATDMPDYDDRPPTKEHYSKTHEKAGVYGLRKLYTDTKRANEEIRIVIGKS